MFRFTIRDVLWLTVVVGLGFAWLIDHARLRAELDSMADSMVDRQQAEKVMRTSYKQQVARLERALKDAGIAVPSGPTIQDVLDAYDRLKDPATK